MAELHIKVSSPAMPLSTEFVRFCKGLEHFYYVMVLASQADASQAAAWRAWLAAGLNPAVRIAPPVDKANRIKVDSRPGVGGFEVTLSGTNQEALGHLRTLLEDLCAARKSLPPGTNDAGRLASVAENRNVQQQLLLPLKNSLARSQIPPDGVDSFMAMIHQGLLAITAGEITSIAVSSA
jgi:hypothetical protein